MPATIRQLDMYVVYKRPKDYPNHYVVRKWLVEEIAKPTNIFHLANSLKAARKFIPKDLHRLPRAKKDEPHVVETWI